MSFNKFNKQRMAKNRKAIVWPSYG